VHAEFDLNDSSSHSIGISHCVSSTIGPCFGLHVVWSQGANQNLLRAQIPSQMCIYIKKTWALAFFGTSGSWAGGRHIATVADAVQNSLTGGHGPHPCPRLAPGLIRRAQRFEQQTCCNAICDSFTHHGVDALLVRECSFFKILTLRQCQLR